MRLAFVALLPSALVACAPVYGDAYLASFANGERAMSAGRCEEAARAFDDAASKAKRVKDRDEARFLEARAYEKCGRFPEVEATYQRLVKESPTGPRTLRAEFEIADLEIEHGDAEKGYALLFDTMHRHPEHGGARPALARLLRREEDKGGDEAALAWLRKIGPLFATTDLDQPIVYESGRRLEHLGRAAEAREVYVATASAHPYPFGGLTDDALEHAAEIDVQLKHPDQAIADLRSLLAPRENSDTVGSYQRPRFSQAQLRIAQIYRDDLHDHASARREFYKLYTDFPTSILRDDALWQDARLAHDDGDSSGACNLLATLAEKLPESRYVACGQVLCSSLPPSKTASGKPAPTCPDYIQRDLTAPQAQGANAADAQ